MSGRTLISTHALRARRMWPFVGLLLVGALAACDDNNTPTEPGGELPPASQAAYLGSEACGFCHAQKLVELKRSGHPYKLNKIVDGQPPNLPFSNVPSPPNGLTWNDVTYMIGGFGWKARFLDKEGFIVTAGGQNQWNLATQAWSDYHKDEKKPYDCGRCHTTGFTPEGHQDGLPGIIGQWAEPGIGCEACHGPGALHADAPTVIPMSVDTRNTQCGSCHNRGGLNDQIPASGGFVKHHEQYNEIVNSGHAELNCTTCHDPHTGVLYNDQEGANAIRLDCEACHSGARASLQEGPLAGIKGSFECTSCHMPQAAKSAVAAGPFKGDVSSHLFAINTDLNAQQFSEDGKLANGFLTLDFACLSCHESRTRSWAVLNAPRIHGENFAAVRAQAPVTPPN